MIASSQNSNFYFNAWLKRACTLPFFCILAAVQVLYAQNKPTPEYKVKAAFIYNFTRFTDWPPAAFSSANSNFVIGIIGNDPFGNYLDDLVKGEKVGTHAIVIQRYHDVKDAVNCHMLYISQDEIAKMKEIVNSVEGNKTLTVSDAANFSAMGGIICFFTDENKIRIQINVTAAKAAQLNISSKLLSVAKIFNSREN